MVHSDSSYGNLFDMKTLQGAAVNYNEATIHCSNIKAKCVCLSANKSEIVAACEALRGTLYFKYVICAIEHGSGLETSDFDKCTTPVIKVDNAGVEAFATNGFGRRTKYLNVRYAKITECI